MNAFSDLNRYLGGILSNRPNKFWAHIQRNLEAALTDTEHPDQDMPLYFAGGTLCLDGKKSLYMLKVNGVGSVNALGTSASSASLFKTSKVYQPDEITALVQKVYLKYKGESEYFTANAKDLGVGLVPA